MPSLEATVTVTKQIEISAALKRKMLAEFKLYQQLKTEYDALELAMAKVKGHLAEMRESTGEKQIEFDGFKTQYVVPVRSELDKKLLIAQGVTTAQIENATVTRPSTAYEKVTCPKAGPRGTPESD